MVRITIEDLPILEELTEEEMANIMGGDGGVILGDVQINPQTASALNDGLRQNTLGRGLGPIDGRR